MKYVAVVVIIIMFVRIDYLLGLFDKAANSFGPAPVEIDAKDMKEPQEIISVTQDKTLQQTPRGRFLALLEDFHSSPLVEIRQRAMGIFKESPAMFNQKLDRELESRIFQWRDLLNNNEPEAVNFMLDLMTVLQGENLEMMKRFFSLWMEINMEHFIAAYSRTKDTNCNIATTFGDAIPEEEKLNEYYEREDALKAFVAKEKIDPLQKQLANNCLLQLGIVIQNLAPKIAPPGEAPVDPNAMATDEGSVPPTGGTSP